MRKSLSIFAGCVMALLLLALVLIKIRYGTGKFYPDFTGRVAADNLNLEKLISLDYPPGNIAVAENGHVYFNYHPLCRPGRFSTATVFESYNGKLFPFPSIDAQKWFRGTFGMTIDRQNRLWLIEPAALDFEKTRIWAFDLTTRQKVHYHEFPKGQAQYSQDLRISADGKYVLLANPGVFEFTNSTLLAYSLEDHTLRTVLEGGKMNPENWLMKTNDGRPYRLVYGLLNFCGGLDGIEISKDGQWLYLAPMSGSHLYRLPMSVALDEKVNPKEAQTRLEDLGQKPMSDGITVDKAGNVIITDVEHGGLASLPPAGGRAYTLTRSKDILWADGVATGPDSNFYFTDSYIPAYLGQFAAAPDLSVLASHRPYFVYRLKQGKL